MIQHTELPVIDEHGDDFLADPFAVTREAREQHWMAKTELGMMTLTYESARLEYSGRTLACSEIAETW